MRSIRHWIPAILYAALIFVLSSIPGDGLPVIPFGLDFLPAWIARHPDKIIHAIEYGILGWLCLHAVARGSPLRFPAAALAALLLASAYGASDEWHQGFVPNRRCDVGDWMADTTGSLLAILILYRFYSRRQPAPA